MKNKQLKHDEIKESNKVVFIYMIFGLFFVPFFVFAQGISTSPEAALPLSKSSVDNPPLFDVISEPVQSISNDSSFIIIFPILVKILLLLFIIFIARKTARYLMIRPKLKEKMNNL